MSTDLYQAGVEAKLPARALKAMRASHSHVVLLTKGKPTMVVQDFAAFQEQRQSLLMLNTISQYGRWRFKKISKKAA